jgi:hypothetical protein
MYSLVGSGFSGSEYVMLTISSNANYVKHYLFWWRPGPASTLILVPPVGRIIEYLLHAGLNPLS